HAWYYFVHPVLFLQFHDPGSERLEPFLCIAEFQRFSGEFISRQLNARAKCVSLPTSIPMIKVFSVIAAIFVFCVLEFISDTSLSCNGFANCGRSANLILH
ncbi:MAG: hypothetical protein ACOX8G_10980, partial [Eubacterium sp.]